MQLPSNLLDEAISRLDRAEEASPQTGDVFEFEPVPLDVFLRDKTYIGVPKLSKIQYRAVEAATQIYFPKTLYELGWKKGPYYKELVYLWGKGSGKDFISRIILLRVAYLLLALKNPQAYFWGEDQQVGVEKIHMLNTATTKEQASNCFFSPLRDYAKRSPFFKRRGVIETRNIKFEKGIYLVSGYSGAESQEGMNIIIGILDEIAAFKTDDEVAELQRQRMRKNIPMSASAVFDFVSSTVQTRFPKVGKVVLLSFPRFKGDYITTAYEEGKKDPKVFTSKAATFEVNPIVKEKDFAREKRKNPDRYASRILCDPTVAEDAFFKNKVALDEAFDVKRPDPVDHFTNRFKSWFQCQDHFPRFGHCDLAKDRCRAAFAFVHAYDFVNNRDVSEDGKVLTTRVPLIKLDVIMYFEASPGSWIDYIEIQDRILEFTDERGFPIELLTFDGYQSIQMMQTLEGEGIPVGEQSVDRTRDAYESWQDAIYEKRFKAYYHKILVEEEIPNLIDWKGRKIEHRKGRGKDGSDAVAGAVHNCVLSENQLGNLDIWTSKGEEDNAKREIG